MKGPLHGRVQVGGSGLTLVADFNALCEIETHFGDLEQGMQQIMSASLSLADLRAVAAALLRHDQPRISHREAGLIISDHFDGFAELVIKTINLAFPEAEPQDQKKKTVKAL